MTSPNCRTASAMRVSSSSGLVTTDPWSIPTLASSAAGLTSAGSGTSATAPARSGTAHSGTGSPCTVSSALSSGLR